MTKSKKTNRLIRTMIIIVATPIILLWAALILLYLPPVQAYAIRKIADTVEAGSDFRIAIGSAGLSFPFKLSVNDFALTHENDGKENKIAEGKEIAASVRLLPLLKGEVEIDYLLLRGISADTRDLIENTRIKGDIGHLRIVARSVNLISREANIKQLNILDTNAAIEITKGGEEKETATPAPEWIVALQKGKIENLELSINTPGDSASIRTHIGSLHIKNAVADIHAGGYTAKHLDIERSAFAYNDGPGIEIEKITLHGKNISYNHPVYAAEIDELTFAQKNGIEITEGKIKAAGNSDGINIPLINIRSTNGTFINGSVQIPFNISKDGKSKIAAQIAARIDKRDAGGFITPSQAQLFSTLPDSLLSARIKIGGTSADVKIDTFAVEIPTIASVGVSGRAKNLADKKKREATLSLNGKIKKSALTAASDTTLLLTLAGQANVKGDLYFADIDFEGSGAGNATAFYDIKNNAYNTKITTNALDIKTLLPQIPLASITMRAALSGQGTDIFAPQTAYQLIADIDRMDYNGAALNQITLSAYQANSFALLSLHSGSRNATLTLLSNNHITKQKITTDTRLDIQNLDLKALGLSEQEISTAINLGIKASTDLAETHELALTGDKIKINIKNKKYTPKPLNIAIATSPEKSSVSSGNGDFALNGTMAGGYTLLLKRIDEIKNLLSKDTLYGIQYFEKLLPATSIAMECGDDNMLHNLLAINGVKFSDIKLRCTLDSIKGLNVHAKADKLSATGIKTDTIKLDIEQEREKIAFYTHAVNTSSKKEEERFSATVQGDIYKNRLNTEILFTGRNSENKTNIAGTTYIEPDKLNIRLTPAARFFGTPITINSDNHITIERNKNISANLVARDRNNAGLHLYTAEDSTAEQDVTLELSNIDLGTLTGSLPFAPSISGRLNCDIHYRRDSLGEALGCDITGDSITYEGTYIGNETIEAVYLPRNNRSHSLALLMRHDGEEVLSLQGRYDDDKKELTGETGITRFPLQIANAFIKDSGLDIDGHIDGTLAIDGKITAPRYNGFIKFDAANIDAPLLGSRLRLVNDKVEIKESKMLFDNFSIYAKGDNPFNINGNIDISNIFNPLLDLRMRARNYSIVDARRQKNSIVYGNLNININSYIKGFLNSLDIQGSATVLGNSNVTYVMSESTIANNNEFDGLIEFVNLKDSTSTRPAESTPELGNITMAINLDIEESAWINADLTPDRSNYVQLQGGGRLNMNYNNEEGLTLTGLYTLNNGVMKYTLPVIPLKTFNISPGSSIQWTGDILNPTLHITALERITAPVNIDDGGSRPVAFDVGIELNNSLDDMDLSFTMQAPENAVIQDELNTLDRETMNKYAVTMLVTGAYVGGKDGITVSNALTSFLDAKINNIAGSAMKDVSINVGIADVENKETGNSYMNYSFSFAKRFWNDRLTIVIGGEVNSGDTPENNQSFINNISLEWKISNSGNRYLRLFYDKNYESILEGEITETGVGYVYKRKLNNLNELLYFKKRDQSKKREINEK